MPEVNAPTQMQPMEVATDSAVVGEQPVSFTLSTLAT